ncbi:MAG: paraquat-inducible protein A [Bacteroidota bacterium]
MENNQKKALTQFAVLSLLFLGLSVFLCQKVIQQTNSYKDQKQEYAASLFFKDRLLNPDEWFGDKKVQAEKIKAAATKLVDAQAARDEAYQYAFYFALLVIVYGILAFLISRNSARLRPAALIVIALACLYGGLFTPMIELSAFEKDVKFPVKFDTGMFGMKLDFEQEFVGEMFFYYQSKSVVELIKLLFQQRNLVVGISILLFSVIMPLGKILSTFAVLINERLANNKIISLWINKAGKWSMADVFVVAMFLSYLAFSNMQVGIQTESQVMLGLYFFFAYVIFAIVSSVLLDVKRPDSLGRESGTI